MTNSLLDDVNALLEKGFGDDRILRQICRACKNDEIISNYERNYVKKLAEEHLGKKPEIIQTLPIEKPLVPDVVLPQLPTVQKTQKIRPKLSRIIPFKLKKSKMTLGIGSLVLIVIIALAVSSVDIPSPPIIPDGLSIQTDLSSYATKNIISISGISDTTGTVNLSIENQNNESVWSEQVSLKNDGRYSTLVIAGGLGWDGSGTYTITADNGVEEKSSTFSFTA